MILENETLEIVKSILDRLRKSNQTITFVESCTGGALAHFLTSVPGCGEVFHQSFVTYSVNSKVKLGVDQKIISQYGVYSQEVAVEMAKAGLQSAVRAEYSVGVTGILEAPRSSPEPSRGEIHVAIVNSKVHHYVKHDIELPSSTRIELKGQLLLDIFKQIHYFVVETLA